MAAWIVIGAAVLALYARIDAAWPLGFAMLLPWMRALDEARSLRGALALGSLMSVAMVVAVFGWFGAAVGAYTGVGATAATGALWVLAPALQPQVVAFALVRHMVGRRRGPGLRALAGAAAWVGCEWLLPKALGDTLGHGLAPSAWLRQFADIGGAAALTVVLLLVNEALLHAWSRARTGGARRAVRPILLAASGLGAVAAYGGIRIAMLDAPPPPGAATLRVAMVQASVTDYERLRAAMGAYDVVRHVLDTHYALSMSAIRDHGADALLWSETVYPTTFGAPKSADGAAFDAELMGFVRTAGVPLVFGTYDRDEAGEYNAAAFVEPARGLLGHYRKTHPFPLTEHVPRWLDRPGLRALLPWAGGWQPGDGARVLPLRTADGRQIEVVPLICLDAVHPGVAIDGARLGAQAIVGLSNDSWFSAHPHGARLHLAVASFRSVETRLPQLRVTTNGISAIIDDTGAIVARTGMGDQAVLTGHVAAIDPPRTLMVRWGDWVGAAGLGLLLALALRPVLARWRGSRTAPVDSASPAEVRVALLTPALRVLAAALRLCAGAGLAWLALDMALRRGWQVASLDQVRTFVVAVVLPAVAAWAVLHACAARIRVDGGALVVERRGRRDIVRFDPAATVHAWRLSLPATGFDVRGDVRRALATRDAASFLRLLSVAAMADRLRDAPLAAAARGRAGAGTPLDAGWLKFGVFPLLPALVAFRLHQHIAFGGTFGEALTYGPLAWLLGVLVWWASWSLGLMLVAAALRVGIETIVGLATVVRPATAIAVRRPLEAGGRALFYLGVPAWLALRLASG